MQKSRRSRGGQAMRVMVLLGGLGLAAVIALPASASAGGAQFLTGNIPAISNAGLSRPPPVPPALVGPDPIYQRGRFDQDGPRDRHRGHRSTTIVTVFSQPVSVAPTRCWYPGHWTYQWVPQWTAYNAWVDQQMSPDGDWVGGYYERRWYPTGSHHAYWGAGSYNC